MTSGSSHGIDGITVVIPTYNDGEHLGRAVRSVLDQEWPPDQVIVVDDGSDPPGPARYVEPFLGGRIRVRLVHKPNGGPSSARNHGLALARTNHVAFLDADDSWEPDFLASKIRLAEIATRPCEAYAGIYGTFVDVATGHQQDFSDADGSIDADIIGRSGGVPGGVNQYLLCRSSLVDVGGFDESLLINEDFDLIARLAKAGYPLLGCAGATYRRTARASSWSRSNATRRYVGMERFFEKAAALGLLTTAEVARRRKNNTLEMARELCLRERSPRAALTLCRRAFTHAPPGRPVEFALWLVSRAVPSFLQSDMIASRDMRPSDGS